MILKKIYDFQKTPTDSGGIQTTLHYLLPKNQPIRLLGLKPGVCPGLILSGAFYPDLKIML
jgi:hypothetical protein